MNEPKCHIEVVYSTFALDGSFVVVAIHLAYNVSIHMYSIWIRV